MDNKWMSTTAGILCIVAGALSLVGLIVAYVGLAIFGSFMPMMPYWQWDAPRWLPVAIAAIGIPSLLLDVLAIIGGIFALKRRHWGVCLAGAIAAVFSSFFLGVVALIFIITGKNAWQQTTSLTAT